MKRIFRLFLCVRKRLYVIIMMTSFQVNYTHQKAEIVCPHPFITAFDRTQPGLLVELVRCSQADIRHSRVRQRKWDTDPLQSEQKHFHFTLVSPTTSKTLHKDDVEYCKRKQYINSMCYKYFQIPFKIFDATFTDHKISFM